MKKKLFPLVVLALSVLFAHAQNIEVNGLQSGVWDADTVFVTGNVGVQDTLCISPGTTVMFTGFYSIRASEGSVFKALGSATDSITFTVNDTTGFHLFDSGRGGWNGIRLDRAAASQFDYCRFQYGKAALDEDQDGGALRIFNCDNVEISHSTLFCNFSREHGGALNAEWSKIVMHDCSVLYNQTYTELDTVYFMYGGGLRFINCDVELIGTDFRNNKGTGAIGGALSLDSCSVVVDRCRFEHNYGINGGGLYLIRSNHRDCRISNSLFANNISGHFGGGLAISDASPLMSNLTVTGNLSEGVNCGGIFFYQYSAPEVWNCIVYGNANNAPLDEPVQIWVWTYDEYVPAFHNCLVQYGLENITGNERILVYENCYDTDPNFANPNEENFRLSSDSPCVDAGSPDTPAIILGGNDLDGNPRVSDNRIDLGAYEYDLTGIQEATQQMQLIHIAGNPITPDSYAEIECEKTSKASLKVYTLDGKLMIDNNPGLLHKGTNRIALGTLFQPLAKGTYLLVIQAGRQSFSAKVVR